MKIENLKKANELSQKINRLDEELKSITEIKNQATPSYSNVGLRLEFVNLYLQVDKSLFNATREEMKFIVDYLIECWQKRKNELETEFEQL